MYPEARRAVEASRGSLPVHDPTYDVAAARQAARVLAAEAEREDVAQVLDLDADGVAVRLYRPDGCDPGLVLHLHGGGFVFNDVEVHDEAVRRLADRARIAVLSIDYRLAPEHRFPAPLEDVDTVLSWLDHDGSGLQLSGPTYVHGDSAGANLALVSALRHPGRFRAVVLHYPFLDPTAGFASYDLGADSDFDPRDAAWYWEQYAATPADLEDPDLAPLRSDRLASLPPTLVTTAEFDPLRDEGEELARRLAEAGVEVVATRYLGQIHGYWRHTRVFPAAEQAIRQGAAFLRSH